jgi:hypothetical protein
MAILHNSKPEDSRASSRQDFLQHFDLGPSCFLFELQSFEPEPVTITFMDPEWHLSKC